MCRRHRNVLWHEILQWPADGSWAVWERAVRSSYAEGQEHLFPQARMGVPQESIFQWWRMHAAPTGFLSVSSKFCSSKSSFYLNIVQFWTSGFCCNVGMSFQILIVLEILKTKNGDSQWFNDYWSSNPSNIKNLNLCLLFVCGICQIVLILYFCERTTYDMGQFTVGGLFFTGSFIRHYLIRVRVLSLGMMPNLIWDQLHWLKCRQDLYKEASAYWSLDEDSVFGIKLLQL